MNLAVKEYLLKVDKEIGAIMSSINSVKCRVTTLDTFQKYNGKLVKKSRACRLGCPYQMVIDIYHD